MGREIRRCRICGNEELISILDLGNQAMTGFFPKDRAENVESEPLQLVKCIENGSDDRCGLVQLKHSFDVIKMYGPSYGYRSALNSSMVEHLKSKIKSIFRIVSLNPGDMVIGIGSNDGTLLRAYPESGLVLVGIDPAGKKFKKYYPPHIRLIPDFFSAGIVKKNFGGKKAKVITSIAMFYDLESPLEFMREVSDILSDDGIWVFEQSYMPLMLEMNSYDTICHEHLEYYRLKEIKWMMDRAGLKVVDIEFNSVNGGSMSVTAAKKSSVYCEKSDLVEKIIREEERKGLGNLKPYVDFRERVFRHRDELCGLIRGLRDKNKKIIGYGASTKGNVILQFCNLTERDICCIAEINEDKFGCYTPGTHIPIISEEEAKKKKPDYFLVLPWHFKASIIAREQDYLRSGGKFIFPMPDPEIVER
ncbi:MAG: class I SAM-dependent methyltransferase [Candidatus Omnitrophica bacterium]|nr:class I SAM-dependent methyltransferase [Candidatus Omnitrophota bacterium]